jgi:nitrate reductase NapAB chaperone NapD
MVVQVSKVSPSIVVIDTLEVEVNDGEEELIVVIEPYESVDVL